MSIPPGAAASAGPDPRHELRMEAAAPDRHPLNPILYPRSVCVIGASERPGSVGAAVVRNLIDAGFAGELIPVNPRRKTVFGIPAHEHVGAIPQPPDLGVICTPARSVPGLVRECGEAGVGGLVIISAGFREAGKEGNALEDEVREELAKFPAMRAVGPNCLGVIVPSVGLNASFARTSAAPGGIALISQSGALCTAILGWARDEGVGFSHFVSIGNMADVDFGDLLDDLADRSETTAVVLYVEAITNAPSFLAAARRCTARKPVIAYKAGRHAEGAHAAASHTGAMAGEDAVYQAAFDEVGIVRINRLDDLLATAELLGRGRWPKGGRLAIVTNAGGPGVIATDAVIAGGGSVAALSAETTGALDGLLPACWSHGNPVDVIGDAGPERLAGALDHVLRDEGVDGALAILTPQAMIDTTEAARAVTRVAARQSKPVVAAWMGGGLVREGTDVLQQAGIATYATPEQAVDAFLHLVAHARFVRAAGERAQHVTMTIADRQREHEVEWFLRDHHGTLTERDSKTLLGMYGIPIVQTMIAETRHAAVAAAREAGYPVVLKVVSPQVSHKADVGGVVLDVRTDEAVGEAFDRIRGALARARPDAVFEGVSVQRMIDRSAGVELIVGAKRDATFGPVVMVGAGGSTAEVMGDRAIGLAPADAGGARRLLDGLRIRPLLNEFRGRPALDVEAAGSVIVRLSRLIADVPSIKEVDANPVLVTADGATALDARVVLNEGLLA